MSVTINGDTGVSKVQDGVIVQADLASGVAGNGPAFSAYRGTSNQSISASTWTKIQFQTEEFDTNNNYDSATNYRFTPTVPGYYQITLSCSLSYTSGAPSIIQASIYKNGVGYKLCYLGSAGGSATGPYGTLVASSVIYLNGSSDYIESYAWSNSASAVVVSDSSFISGYLARAA